MGAVQRRPSGSTGLDLDLEAERANPSLGVPETALLRRINVRANHVLEPPRYRPLVRELLAHQTLSRRSPSPRLTLPPDAHAWAPGAAPGPGSTRSRTAGTTWSATSTTWSASPPPEPYADPDHPDEAQVADAALDAITALLLENARLLRDRAAARARARRRRAATCERSYLRPTYRLREKVVRRLDGSRVGRGLLAVYRRARGRSSRSA